jgi:hypothetical protein
MRRPGRPAADDKPTDGDKPDDGEDEAEAELRWAAL